MKTYNNGLKEKKIVFSHCTSFAAFMRHQAHFLNYKITVLTRGALIFILSGEKYSWKN